jgi:iron(III) transport system substrate-binding protein
MTPNRASLRRLPLRVLTSAIIVATVSPVMITEVGAQDAAEPLTVYSGRSESLVGPIIERFAEESGLDVEVRYGDTAELAAVLLEEGERSPADVFFAQDGGALGAVAAAGLLAPLETGLLERVPSELRDPDGRWVGVSGRARTVAYTTREEVDLPDSILGFTDPAWAGRIGWVPGNGSFQAFVTALRVVEGEDTARAWLDGILANEPVVYESNASAVEGVAAGEVDVAFVNHYYLLQLIAEHGTDYPVAQHFFGAGDVGSLVNVAGLGELATTDQREGAAAFIDFMLAEEAQRYFAEQSFEYPLIAGIAADPRLPALTSLESPSIDLSDLADLQGTVEMLRDVGAID